MSLQKMFISKEELYRLYWIEMMSTEQIAKMYGVTGWAVCGQLRSKGISVRTKGEGSRLALKQGRRHSPMCKGEKASNWRGGRRILDKGNGYVRIYYPDSHPRKDKDGYVLEHILIWENTHRKPLPKGWVIHHLNGIKYDNRPENLVAMPSKKHYLLIPELNRRIKELEELLDVS